VAPKSRLDSSLQDSSQKNHILGDNKSSVDAAASFKEKTSALATRRIDLKILPQAFPLDLASEDPFTSNLNSATMSKPLSQINSLDDYPVAAMNPVQFSQAKKAFPTTLCSLALLLRPNQPLNSRQPPTSAAVHTSTPSDMSLRHGLNRNPKTSKKLEPTSAFPVPNIADRVRLVPHPTVPIGFIHLPPKFRHRWFESLAVALHPRSSFQLDKPGDYEYVRFVLPFDCEMSSLSQLYNLFGQLLSCNGMSRIGPSKELSTDMSQSNLNETGLPENPQSTSKKSEECVHSRLHETLLSTLLKPS
jgi:hypothetical protein